MMPIYLSPEDAKTLEFELIPMSVKVKVTRLLRRKVCHLPIYDVETLFRVRYMNCLINRARNLVELPPYLLETDEYGELLAADLAWHEAEFEIAFLRLNPVQFIEFMAEIVEEKYLLVNEANKLLQEANSSVLLQKKDENKVQIILDSPSVKADLGGEANVNLRTLIARVDAAIDRKDYADVLSNCASAFEVISKELIGASSIQSQTFGSYFERYKKDSSLPEEVADWMLDIYKKRNTEPIAGHGHTDPPNISGEEAVLIAEMTKAFVRYEQWAKTKDLILK